MTAREGSRPQPGELTGIGIDGCRGGWCGFALVASGFDGQQFTDSHLLGACKPNLERLFAALSGPPDARLCLDMPIGLPQGTATRACDDAARRALGPRRASVFAAPPRAVLNQVDHGAANALARRESGRGLSLQSFHLLPKIREVDGWLQRDREACGRTAECHPELAFARLSGAPLADSKRTPAGRAARFALLEALVPGASATAAELLASHPRAQLAHDDVADALVLAIVACLPERALESLGAASETVSGAVDGAVPLDAAGLPMLILAPRVDWRSCLLTT